MLTSSSDGAHVVGKPWGLGRRFAASAVAFLGIGALIFLVAGVNTEGRLSGAGSTFVNPILQRVSTAYQGYLAADRVDPTRQEGASGDWTAGATALDYDPVGSVGGLTRLSDPAVGFAATEVPLTPAEMEAKGLIQFPLIIGAAAPVANLDLGGRELTLDAEVLAAIYGGTVTNWSDPAIAALNPGLALPDSPIAVRHRSDGSGTTWTFTGYLAQAPGWTAGRSAQVAWPVGEGAKGSRGIIEAVKATPGAIGYSEAGQARAAGLTVARLVNGAGETLEASPETVRAASIVTGWEPGRETAPASLDQGWPMTALVYVAMRADAPEAERTLAFFRYFYAEAARQAEALGYVPLPPEVVTKIEAYWTSVYNDKQS